MFKNEKLGHEQWRTKCRQSSKNDNIILLFAIIYHPWAIELVSLFVLLSKKLFRGNLSAFGLHYWLITLAPRKHFLMTFLSSTAGVENWLLMISRLLFDQIWFNGDWNEHRAQFTAQSPSERKKNQTWLSNFADDFPARHKCFASVDRDNPNYRLTMWSLFYTSEVRTLNEKPERFQCETFSSAIASRKTS